MAELGKSEEVCYSKIDRTVKTRPRYSHSYSSSSDDEAGDCNSTAKYEEWAESKRKINHKTRQVETRVQRQLVMEDGKVIADSGPQIVTRIKEDNKVEESEKKRTPKNGKTKILKSVTLTGGGSCDDAERVLGEKKEIHRVSREMREENMQYHDENLKELSGHDVHRKALCSPNELITITNKSDSDDEERKPPRGKMVHYEAKGKKSQDTDEILEVSKLAIDGSVTKEVKRTRHHEEFSDDEKPDETGEAEALWEKPTVTRSSRRHFDYVNDFDDDTVPNPSSDTDSDAGSKKKADRKPVRNGISKHEASPKYSSNPLLGQEGRKSPASPGKTVRLDQISHNDSSSEDEAPKPKHQATGRTSIPVSSLASKVEIPEEYKLNRQRLIAAKNKSQR